MTRMEYRKAKQKADHKARLKQIAFIIDLIANLISIMRQLLS